MAKGNSTPQVRRDVNRLPDERWITVGYGFHESRAKGAASSSSAARPVPWIRLKGRWLAEAGFEIGARLKIRVMRGCLVLTMERQDED